jgi:hypothetical protein
MSTGDTPQITMVEVPRHDVTLQMEDILGPLAQTAAALATAPQASIAAAAAQLQATAAEPSAELLQYLQTFNDLVNQLRDVVSKINQIDPNVLASKPGAPPAAGTN